MRYTEEEKRRALDCLEANGGNAAHTSAQIGIPARTLSEWARREQERKQEAADAEQVMARLQNRLVENVMRLADSLEAKIDDAPLNQHASALAQLVDRLIKLAEKLPQPHADDNVIRIEYVDADGSIHQTPYWTRDDSEI